MIVCVCVSPQFLSEGDQQARQQQEIETLEKTLTLQEKVSGFISTHRHFSLLVLFLELMSLYL